MDQQNAPLVEKSPILDEIRLDRPTAISDPPEAEPEVESDEKEGDIEESEELSENGDVEDGDKDFIGETKKTTDTASVDVNINSSPAKKDGSEGSANAVAAKTKKSTLTRTKENDFLLSIYDSFSAYRRPSSKPSLVRKLDSIDQTISLLQQLRDQLTLQPSEAEPSSPSPSGRVSSSNHMSPSPSKAPFHGSKQTLPKASSASKSSANKPPTSPYHVYCSDRLPAVSQLFPDLPNKALKEKMSVEWKQLSVARAEVFVSKFVYSSGSHQTPDTFMKLAVDNHPRTIEEVLSLSNRSSKDANLPSPVPIAFYAPKEASTIAPSSQRLQWTFRANLKNEAFSEERALKVEPLWCGTTSGPFTSVAISSNGKTLAISDEKWAHLYDIRWVSSDKEPSKVYGNFDVKFQFSIPIRWSRAYSRFMCLSPDGTCLYVTDADLVLKKWDLEKRAQVAAVELPPNAKTVVDVSMSPDSKWVAIGCEDKLVRLFDADTLAPKRILGGGGEGGHKRIGPFSAVTAVAFSPRSVYLACASLDGSVRVWEIGSGNLVVRFDAHRGAVTGLCWRNETDFVCASSDNRLSYWSITQPTREESIPFNKMSDMQYCVAVDPIDSKAVWSAGRDNVLRLWFPPTMTEFLGQSSDASESSSQSPSAAVIGLSGVISDVKAASFEGGSRTLLAVITLSGTCSLWSYL